MKLGFISDLHLSENTPSVTQGFFAFLKTAAQELSHLYILGDLFEAWVGDDNDSELATNVMQEINHATRNGLEIFLFMAIEISYVAKNLQSNLISPFFQTHTF